MKTFRFRDEHGQEHVIIPCEQQAMTDQPEPPAPADAADQTLQPPLTLEEARQSHVCRYCRGTDSPRMRGDGTINSFVYHYGREYAHADCIPAPADAGRTPPQPRGNTFPGPALTDAELSAALAGLDANSPLDEPYARALVELQEARARNAGLEAEIAEAWDALQDYGMDAREDLADEGDEFDPPERPEDVKLEAGIRQLGQVAYQWQEERDGLADRNAELEAIVATLPVCWRLDNEGCLHRDVPMYLGQRVWSVEAMHLPGTVQEIHASGPLVRIAGDEFLTHGEDWGMSHDAAAWAAAKEEEESDG